MTLAHLGKHRHRAWLAAFVVPLLCLRMLVPAGFMPEMGSDGWVTLQLCTAQGFEPRRVQLNLPVAATEHAGNDAGPDSERGECPYAFVAGTLPAADVPALPDFVPIAALAVTADAGREASRPLARSQSARGPPGSPG